MSADQLLTKYDFGKFLWKLLSTTDGSQCLVRPLAGCEILEELWNRFEKGNQTLFFAVDLDLASPQSEATFVAAARDAWILLRRHTPIIAKTIEIDENDVPMFKYRVPNAPEVTDWADRTLIVHRQHAVDLNQLREELGGQKIPTAAGDQTFMHIAVDAPNSAGEVTQIGCILHIHHSVTDGRGAKIITNQYLTELGKQLGSTQKLSMQWGTEVENLTPAMLNVLGAAEPRPIPPDSDEQPTFDHPLYGTLGAEMQNIGQSMQNTYGFKPRDGDNGWPNARRVELVFSKEESHDLLSYMKAQPYTLTVLAHAALAIVVMFYNPASQETAKHTMNNFCMVDVRPRLESPYSSRHGYAGYALAPPMCRLPVALFLSPEGTSFLLDKDLLIKVMDDIRAQYAAHKKMVIAYIAQLSDMFAYGMKQGYAANQSVPNQCYMFSSDGKGEKILDATFTGENGQTFFTVAKFFTSINHPHPAPYFRLSSWKEVLDIGADFNANLISAAEVKVYMAKWKEFMFLVMN